MRDNAGNSIYYISNRNRDNKANIVYNMLLNYLYDIDRN